MYKLLGMFVVKSKVLLYSVTFFRAKLKIRLAYTNDIIIFWSKLDLVTFDKDSVFETICEFFLKKCIYSTVKQII